MSLWALRVHFQAMTTATKVHLPLPLAELLHQRKPVRNANAEYQDRMSRLERVAVFVTNHVGTMGFFLIIMVWTLLWLGWNFLAPPRLRFDPPMGFVFWLFISNLIQLHLMPLIMVAQNLQERHSEIRAQSEYELSVSSEREIETILRHLEYQNVVLISLVKKLGVSQVELEEEFKTLATSVPEHPMSQPTDTNSNGPSFGAARPAGA